MCVSNEVLMTRCITPGKRETVWKQQPHAVEGWFGADPFTTIAECECIAGGEYEIFALHQFAAQASSLMFH